LDNALKDFILLMQSLGADFSSLITLLLCLSSILLILKYFGKSGLFMYNCLAVIISNIQVLKFSEFSISPEALPLGTVTFATTFLVSDILTEHYGADSARKALYLSFVTQILFALLMVLAVCHPTVNYGLLAPDLAKDMAANDNAFHLIFSQSPRFLIASMVAYYTSQTLDIWVFKKIRELSGKRFIWLRQNLSMAISGLLDNFVFSLVAWVILNPSAQISSSMFVGGCVIASYVLRVIVNILSTPAMYLSYKFLPNNHGLPS